MINLMIKTKVVFISLIMLLVAETAYLVLTRRTSTPITSKPNSVPSALVVSDNEIRFNGTLLETKSSLPYLFPEISDMLTFALANVSQYQLIQVDRLVYRPNSFTSNATAFYKLNYDTGKYERVLASSPDQASFKQSPGTKIVSTDPFTVRFNYEISRPIECYGYGCYTNWAEFYRWDSNQEKFVDANSENKDYYRQLYDEYQKMDSAGCTLRNSLDNLDLKTLTDVYKYNDTAHCGFDEEKFMKSTREELNRFIETKDKILKIIS